MALKFAMIVQMIDRLSAPGKKMLAGTRDLTKSARDMARTAPGASRALTRMSVAAARIPARLRLARMQIKALAGRAGMKGLELATKGAGWAIGTLIGKTLRLAAGLAKLAVSSAALATGALFGGAIRIGAAFEDLEVRLARIVGSADEARRQLRWLVDQRLPVPIEQLGEAFVQARKAGIDVTAESLRALVDEAISSKKEITDIIDTIKEAKNSDLGGLQPFDIQATRKNGRVLFQWLDKTGQRMTRDVRDNARDIERALIDIFGQRSKGAADDYARTFKGLLGGLGIWWQRFQLKVADAGIFDKLKSKLQAVTDWLDRKLADGSINKWAEQISSRLEQVVDWADKLVRETDWKKLGSDLGDVASAAWTLAKALAAAVNWASKLVSTQDKIARNGSTTVVDGGSLFRIRRANEAPPPPRKPPAVPVRSSPRATPINLRGTRINPGASTPQKVAVGGSMTVHVKTDPGLTARPTKMSSANNSVPLVYRGGANMGWG